ncbi:hypothetical protein CBM2599_A10297 [Cupriavidus taiwanensis]|nr:hypothetical protein CBM2599_A10297 [Cupriavidus taiwanensis]SOY80485.1 hypothetical protein CBM2600_A10142 [Cupriavidus taiwanensis]
MTTPSLALYVEEESSGHHAGGQLAQDGTVRHFRNISSTGLETESSPLTTSTHTLAR